MINTIIGIDPGKSGAMAVLRGSERLDGVYDCPLIKAKDVKPEFDRKGMVAFVKHEIVAQGGHSERVFAIIESQHAFAQQGGVGNFTAGLGYGLWLGILQTLDIEPILVTSQRWRKAIFTAEELDWCNDAETKPERRARRKELSIKMAKKLFSKARPFLTRKKDDGRAEAILIATSWARGGMIGA